MADVTFARDFDYRVPGKQSTIGYKAGWSGKVPAAHAEAAKAAGALTRRTADGPGERESSRNDSGG